MVVVIRKAVRGAGFDIHAPAGFEEHDELNVSTLADAQAKADRIADTIGCETRKHVEIWHRQDFVRARVGVPAGASQKPLL